MSHQSRNPQIGDLLVVSPDPSRVQWIMGEPANQVYTGIVYKIECDADYGPNKVFVQWSGSQDPGYNIKHGYSGMNIHNLRSKFKVIRNGIDIK